MPNTKRSSPPPKASTPKALPKKPLKIGIVMQRIRRAVQPFAKAALFELYEDGFTSPFEQLVACMISIRTRDEATIPVARRLFAVARSPEQTAGMSVKEVDSLIHGCAFHRGKAAQIHAIAQVLVREHAGKLPCDQDVLLGLPGVGRSVPTSCWGLHAGSRTSALTFMFTE